MYTSLNSYIGADQHQPLTILVRWPWPLKTDSHRRLQNTVRFSVSTRVGSMQLGAVASSVSADKKDWERSSRERERQLILVESKHPTGLKGRFQEHGRKVVFSWYYCSEKAKPVCQKATVPEKHFQKREMFWSLFSTLKRFWFVARQKKTIVYKLLKLLNGGAIDIFYTFSR